MKKFAALLLLFSLGMFVVGCADDATAPTTEPTTTEPAVTEPAADPAVEGTPDVAPPVDSTEAPADAPATPELPE